MFVVNKSTRSGKRREKTIRTDEVPEDRYRKEYVYRNYQIYSATDVGKVVVGSRVKCT